MAEWQKGPLKDHWFIETPIGMLSVCEFVEGSYAVAFSDEVLANVDTLEAAKSAALSHARKVLTEALAQVAPELAVVSREPDEETMHAISLRLPYAAMTAKRAYEIVISAVAAPKGGQ